MNIFQDVIDDVKISPDAPAAELDAKNNGFNALVERFDDTDNIKTLYVLNEIDDEYEEVKKILKSGKKSGNVDNDIPM